MNCDNETTFATARLARQYYERMQKIKSKFSSKCYELRGKTVLRY